MMAAVLALPVLIAVPVAPVTSTYLWSKIQSLDFDQVTGSEVSIVAASE